jgi:hypothetical protein
MILPPEDLSILDTDTDLEAGLRNHVQKNKERSG